MPRTRSILWSQLKLGIVGVVAIVLASMLIIAVGGQAGFFWQRYKLNTKFDDVQGMKTGAIVRVAGKDVGKVTRVEFAGAQIDVGLEISESVRSLITTESRAKMGSLSLLGEPIIVISASTEGRPLADGEYLPSLGSGGPIADLTAGASKTMESAQAVIADIRAGKGTVGKLFTDEAVYNETQRLIAVTTDVAKRLERGEGTLGALLTDRAAYTSTKASIDNLRMMTEAINRGEGPLGRLLRDEALAKSMSATASSVERVAGRLDRGEGTAGKLLTDETLYRRFNDLAARVDKLVASVEAGQGTAGKLLKDQQLYDTMNKAVAEMLALVADIRKDPKKFLTVRVSIF